jgi:hypothetical protein
MPFSFHPDERRGILHISAFGTITDAELLDRLSHEPSFVTGWPILSDCSAVTAVLISSNLIESFAKSARTRQNLATIIAPNPVAFGLARMYQIFSDPADKRIRVFSNAHEARVWLSEEMKEAALHTDEISEVTPQNPGRPTC